MENNTRDRLFLKILLFDNILTLQLVIMSPALTAPAKAWLCPLLCAAGYLLCAAGVYYASLRLTEKYSRPAKYAAPPLLTFAVCLFFTTPAHALSCTLLTALSELLLICINDRLRTAGIRPALRILAALINAGVLSMAMAGLRF